ncbi:hypothetical protein [Hydrogenimonas sp.]
MGLRVKNFEKRKKLKTVGVSRPKRYRTGDISYEEAIYGNVWFRLMKMEKAGSRKIAHKHNFDHVHFVASGAVRVFRVEEIDGRLVKEEIGEYHAPAWIKVPKGAAHEVEAIEPNTTAICVQAVRDENGETLQTEYCDPYAEDVEVTRL